MTGGRQRPDRAQLGGRVQSGSWGRDLLEQSIDREDELRQARPVAPSTSSTPRRCTACHEWSRADQMGLCEKCRIPFEAAPLVGLTPVKAA